jgi:Gram-negative bacterial TonB protein C-terminal
MKSRKVLLVAAGYIIYAAASSLASDIKVIANSSVKADTISAMELKRVFLGEKISLEDGTHVEPVLEKDGPAQQAFLKQYIGITEDDLQTYYRTRLFTGKGSMPKAFGSDEEVVAYVARTRGAIGYVSIAAGSEGVKILAIGPTSSTERKLLTRIEPDYPETLRRLNIGGIVRLRISISAKGQVEHVELLGGNPILAESATIAVMKWVYTAGRSPTIADVSIPFGEH